MRYLSTCGAEGKNYLRAFDRPELRPLRSPYDEASPGTPAFSLRLFFPYPQTEPPHAQCFPEDKLPVWQQLYCLKKSGAASIHSKAYAKCEGELSSDRSLPAERCPRILWLKERVCADDPAAGRSREECLRDAQYLYKISSDPYFGP